MAMPDEVLEILGRVPAKPLSVPATAVSVGLSQRAVILTGWSLAESTGSAAATVDIYDGRDDKGALIASVGIPAGDSKVGQLPPDGVICEVGLYLSVTSGSVKGALYAKLGV